MSPIVSRTLGLVALALAVGCTRAEELATETQPIQQVSQSGAGAYEATLATLPDGFAAAWYDTRDGNAEIYLRFLDRSGRPLGSELRLTDNPELSYEADIGFVDGSLAVAWYEQSGDSYEAKLGSWSLEGRQLWVQNISTPNRNGRIPVLRTLDDEVFVAWVEDAGGEDFEVWAGWWDALGQPVAAPQKVADAGPTTWNLNAALDEQGRAWVVLDAAVGTRAEEVFLIRVAKDGSQPALRLTADDGLPSTYPDVALSGDRVALTWVDQRDGSAEVYLFVGTRKELDEGLDRSARRVTKAAGAASGVYVAWNEDQIGLSWNDDSAGQQEVYFQTFGPLGVPTRDAMRVTNNSTESLVPSIRAWEQGFALLWNEYAPGEDPHGADGRSEIVFTVVHE